MKRAIAEGARLMFECGTHRVGVYADGTPRLTAHEQGFVIDTSQMYCPKWVEDFNAAINKEAVSDCADSWRVWLDA